MTYNAYIAKITNVRKHPNADRLLLGECFGNQLVVGLATREGDVGIYFPADGRLSPEFLTANNLVRKLDAEGKNVGGLFDENGKVRTQKLRGEKSDGFFCPVEFLSYTGVDISTLQLGLEFNEINGQKFCEKYHVVSQGGHKGQAKKPRERSKFRYFLEHQDTQQLAYKLGELRPGMNFILTEKVHGTSQRSALALEEHYSLFARIVNGLFKRTLIQPKTEYKYVCGTRRVVIKDFDRHDGWYQENEGFRQKAHNRFVGQLNEGEEIFYEVVGYAGPETPIMPPANNTKLQDKEFVKKYGKTTTFTYGCEPGQSDIYVYRISHADDKGNITDLPWDAVQQRCNVLGVKSVPELARFTYDGNGEQLLKTCSELITRDSTVTNKHIMEGTVVRADGNDWQAWKNKSWHFKVLEDIIKLDATASDMEEAQDPV